MMSTKKLLIDNFDLSAMNGLKRIYHGTEKLKNPVLSPDRPWEMKTGREGVACPKILFDEQEKIYKMWYWSSVDGLKNLYATSRDGINWDRPNLGIVEFNQSLENNIISTPARIGPGAVLYSPQSVPQEGGDKLYRTLSWLPSEKLKQRYIPIFSPDGLRWHTHDNIEDEAGISGPGVGDTGTVMQADDNFPMERDNVQGRYIAFPRLHVKVGKWNRRSVGMAYTDARPDRKRLMLDWSLSTLVLAPDFIDDEMAHERLAKAFKQGITHYDDSAEHHCEFYTMQPWREGDVYLGVVYIFDISMNMDRRGAWNQHGIMEIQLVYSRDLVHWERLGDRQPWIGRGEPGTFDDSMVHFASTPVRVGDQMFIYYTGGNVPHPMVNYKIFNEIAGQVLAGTRHAVQHIGCAAFRPDGYVSLQAGGETGKVMTKPFVWEDEGLFINADARNGELIAAICDAEGKPIEGLVSEPVNSNEFNMKLVFHSGKTANLKGCRVTVEFSVRNADFYSYTV